MLCCHKKKQTERSDKKNEKNNEKSKRTNCDIEINRKRDIKSEKEQDRALMCVRNGEKCISH